MHYQKYLDLGFKRIDCNDSVEFKQTGNESYVLTYKISKKLSIEVSGASLLRPRLYIKTSVDNLTYHIISISVKCMLDFIKATKNLK